MNLGMVIGVFAVLVLATGCGCMTKRYCDPCGRQCCSWPSGSLEIGMFAQPCCQQQCQPYDPCYPFAKSAKRVIEDDWGYEQFEGDLISQPQPIRRPVY